MTICLIEAAALADGKPPSRQSSTTVVSALSTYRITVSVSKSPQAIGRMTAGGLGGPVPCGPRFSRDPGKPTQVTPKTYPVGYSAAWESLIRLPGGFRRHSLMRQQAE